MYVRLLSRYEDVASLSEAWNAMAHTSPFLRWEWLGAWWRHFGRGRRLFVPVVYDEAYEILGLAPWYSESHPAFGQVVRFLGSGEVCSDYLTLPAQPGREVVVAEAIADWLDVAAPEHRWDLLDLEGATNDDPAVWRLIEQLAHRGNTLHRRDHANCWRIALPRSWNEYVARLSKSHRKSVQRAKQRAEDLNRAKLYIATTPAELDRGWQILVDLHQRRRLSLGEPGCFASQRFHDFLREASELLIVAGLLEIGWLEFDGQPIAVEYVIKTAGVSYVYQAGIDPDRLDEEPGRMISALLLQRAITSGQQGFDYLRGDEPYKAHWRAEPCALTAWRVVPRRALPQLRHTAWLAGGAMKDWLKNARTRFSEAQTS